MPLSEKQKAALLSPPKKFEIYHGAVRSGKTFVSILRWLDIIRTTYNPDNYPFLMSGFSKESLRQNVLEHLFEMIGEENYRLVDNKLTLFSKYKVEFFGGGKVDSEKAIRGRTYAGWYADEVTLQHKTFVNQALARCSVPGARILWTTNPDHPEHFIYKDYIQNDKINKNLFHFFMDDNLTLTEEYKETLKNSFSGVFYERNVLGKWVVADGLVYADFNKEKHIVSDEIIQQMIKNKAFKYYIAGTDWGHTHPMTGLIIGITHDNMYYLIDEFYETEKLTEDLIMWYKYKEAQLGQKIYYIACDSAEPDRIILMKQQKLNTIKANKEINSGLNAVMTCFKNDRLYINERAKNTIKELQMYRYPDKDSAQAKKDQPLDEFNHAMDALRYAIYKHSKILENEKALQNRGKRTLLF